jgi:ssDNA-binding Zn-finger/Zn-ribbon topoisomerase 1
MTNEIAEQICEHCGTDLRITNPDSGCEHLYYPENCKVCSGRERKRNHPNELTIKLPDLLKLAEDGKKIVFSGDAESALVAFLEHEAKVAEVKEQLKEWIKQSALSYSKSFSSVSSDKVSVMYRAYGAAFGLEQEIDPEAEAELIDAGILKEEVKHSWKIDSKALEAYVKEHNAVPAGIATLPRTKQISLSLKKDKKDE